MFDDIIADMEANKKLSPIVTELLLRERKLNISPVLGSQSYFKVCKTIRLKVTYYFVMKIPNERELQKIASDHLSDTEFKDFMKFYKDYTKESIKIYEEPIIKMTVIEKTKTIDNKTEQNKAQYDLDSQTARITPLSSGKFSKCYFLTGKDVLPEKTC